MKRSRNENTNRNEETPSEEKSRRGQLGVLARIALLTAVIGSGASQGCGGGSGAVIDENGDVQCGECSQFAYRCWGSQEMTGSPTPECAPDDLTVSMVCNWWDQKEDCAPEGGSDGGDSGSGTGGGGSCANWDPDAYVSFNRQTGKYEVEQTLIDDINANPSLLTDCDSNRMRLRSGGYYEPYNVGRDDLVSHLGVQELDLLLDINGYDLQTRVDWDAALLAVSQDTEFVLTFDRNLATVTQEYVVVP